MERIAVVGAGLVGSLEAVYLAKRGYEVHVFEGRHDIRKTGEEGGRSINLALSDRGWKALEGVGLGSSVREIAIPMRGRMMHSVEGELTFQPYGKEGQAIYSVSRAGLNRKMMEAADAFDNVQFYFNRKCLDLEPEPAKVEFLDRESGKEETHSFDHVIGTDGAFSAVRTRLQKTDRFDFSQSYLQHGYKELSIPPNADGSHKMDSNSLHIWPRGRFMMIALPNLDGSYTCTLFLPFEGENSFEELRSEQDVQNFFEKTFPDAIPLMPTLKEDFFSNPTSSLVTIRCFPWHYKDKVLLLGDAAHAIVPFYGQGMNAGFEDCTVLESMMDDHPDMGSLFRAFSRKRKPDADAIADLAISNFIEMRDKTADPNFLLQKRIEKRLSEKYPEKWVPLYSQVTFSHAPYSQALEKGKQQERIMAQVMEVPDIENRWDSEEVERMILDQLDEMEKEDG